MVNLKAQYSLRAFLLHRPTEGIIMIDAGGKILQLNPAAAALFRYDSAELIGQSIQVLIPADNLLPIDNDKKEIVPGRSLARKKEGTEFPAQLNISYCQQPGQRLAFISVMDVSGQHTIPICGR